ncbi:MAG: U32 family peptidase [Clostridiaceae bacterium]|nr:U32 family peptidase [Clostridiaceae bacterium]
MPADPFRPAAASTAPVPTQNPFPRRRPELLAPAGDPEKLRTAILYGADAVYLGGREFSLRASGGNFSQDELADAVRYAHSRQVRVYLAMNIFAHPDDMGRLRDQVRQIAAAEPDAVIVSDPGVFTVLREEAPQLDIHISTQASVTNARTCRFWQAQGARRIILARELTLEEIRRIREDIPADLELEAFVHGAMCMAYSGRCLLSSFFTGRDSNRGQCAQPCRWAYEIVEEKRPDQPLTVTGDERGSYFFNSRDLCMIEQIPDLVESGLDSLKIEGRIKSAFYVATVVKAYREALDAYMADPAGYKADPAWLLDLQKTVHRPFDTGFYYQRPQDDAKIALTALNQREAAVVGIVRAWLPGSGLALIEQRNRILAEDQLELVQPRGRHTTVMARGMTDLEHQPISSAPHPQMLFYLPLPDEAKPGSYLLRLGDKDRPGILRN